MLETLHMQPVHGATLNVAGYDESRWPSNFSCLVDPADIPEPSLAALRRYWHSKRRQNRLPSRADIDVLDLWSHVGSLFLIEVLDHGSDFRFRLIGVNITTRFGRDSTGRTFSEVYRDAEPRTAAWLLNIYRTVVRDQVPVLSGAPLRQVQREYIMATAIHLPLSGDGISVNMILGETRFGPSSQS